jgi:ceramide glucosyltransferase
MAIWNATKFMRARRSHAARDAAPALPAVSILKPVQGTDPGAYESFRSHCLQDYPEYEIIFAVSDPADAAVPLIERLQREFPTRSIRIAVCPQVLGMNRKVGKLVQILPQARYDYLLINDGDVRVPPEYLREVMKPFTAGLVNEARVGLGNAARVGMVTCLYRGTASATLGSKLEALGINTDFAGGVLVARQIEGGLRFGLGATLAFSRQALESIGGFEPLVDYLADDYELGARIAASGYKVALSDQVVEVFVPAYSFAQFFEHQLRWGRSTRNSRKFGYTGLALTFGATWAMLAVIASGGAPVAWAVFAVAAAARVTMAAMVGAGVLRARSVARDLWLVPLRDLIAFAVWVASYTGRTVAWRGHYFILKNGKLRPAA